MKTLAEYLTEYLDQEVVMSRPNKGKMKALNIHEIRQIVADGIEAYESTESCTITMSVKSSKDETKWRRVVRRRPELELEIVAIVEEIETMKARLLSFIIPCLVVNSAMDGIRKTIEDKLRLCGYK